MVMFLPAGGDGSGRLFVVELFSGRGFYCVRMRNRRSFDFAPYGRSAQDDTFVKYCSCLGWDLMHFAVTGKMRGFLGSPFDALRLLRVRSE